MGLDIAVDGLDRFATGRSATPEELAALDEHGFVIVPALLSGTEVSVLDGEFEHLVAGDPQSSRHELGTRRAQAARDNEVFAVCWRHRVVLDAAAHVLGPVFQVGHVDLRDPDPGHGEQLHHPDHGAAPVPGITATWFLDPFTAANGATRLLPGSHRSLPPNSRVMEGGLYWIPDSRAPIAGEVVAIGPAGSLLLRHARLFHAAGRITARVSRRSAFVFCQHEIPEPEARLP
jgi:ectoine hydroxylase-related dioxygenase (phytanoyl-CoA dioxygenase family)